MDSRETVVGAGSGRTHSSPFGDSLRWIIGEEATADAYSLHERTAPPGAASVPHIHSRVSEAFYVLEGEFTFELDGRTVNAGPGDYVHAPASVSHAWRVTSSGDAARGLFLFAHTAPLAFFAEYEAVLHEKVSAQVDLRL